MLRDEPIIRGCGVRVRAGVYLETPLSRDGVPLDRFLVCPPQPVDAGRLRLEPMGVRLVDVNGVTHVFDWIGSEHYPNVADILNEIRRHGASRRVSRNIDFDRLTPESRLVLLHHRAILLNADELWKTLEDEAVERWPGTESWQPRGSCPKGMDHVLRAVGQEQPGFTCHALYDDLVECGEVVLDPRVAWRTVDRSVGSTTYRARRTPDCFEPEYRLGIFAMLPIGQVTVIHDPEGGRHEEALAKARRANLPVKLEDQ